MDDASLPPPIPSPYKSIWIKALPFSDDFYCRILNIEYQSFNPEPCSRVWAQLDWILLAHVTCSSVLAVKNWSARQPPLSTCQLSESCSAQQLCGLLCFTLLWDPHHSEAVEVCRQSAAPLCAVAAEVSWINLQWRLTVWQSSSIQTRVDLGTADSSRQEVLGEPFIS